MASDIISGTISRMGGRVSTFLAGNKIQSEADEQ